MSTSNRQFAHAVVYVALWLALIGLCLPLTRGRFWGALTVVAVLLVHVMNAEKGTDR